MIPSGSLVDMGANLHHQDVDLEEVCEKAADANISLILGISNHLHDVTRYIALFETTDLLRCTAGLHPHYSHSFHPSKWRQISQLAAENPRIVAIGLTGLDYYRLKSTKDEQKENFQRHIELASLVHKPLYLYYRNGDNDDSAFGDLCGALQKDHVPPRFLVQCFTGNSAELEILLEMGAYVILSGALFYTRRFPDVTQAVQMWFPRYAHRFLLQSCSPFFCPPEWKRLWKTNHNRPDSLFHLLKHCSRILDVSEYELLSLFRKNTAAVLT